MSDSDRVTYSYGMKIGLPNYSSVDFHVGLSSDIREGESKEKAFARVKRFVDEEAAKELEAINELRDDEIKK